MNIINYKTTGEGIMTGLISILLVVLVVVLIVLTIGACLIIKFMEK